MVRRRGRHAPGVAVPVAHDPLVAGLPADPRADLRQRRVLGHCRGSRRQCRAGAVNRRIEELVHDLGGHKSLYSEAFYDQETFEQMYGGEMLAAARGRYDPDGQTEHPLRESGEEFMTTDVGVRLSIADALGRLMKDGLPFRFEAFDGSVGRPRGRADHAAPAQRARPGLPHDVTGRPRLRARLRLGRPRARGRPPGQPLRRHGPDDEPAPVQDAVGCRDGADRPQPRLRQPQAPAAASRRSTSPSGAAPWRACGTTRSVTPRRSTTTTTSPTASTSSCSARR